MDPRPGGMKVWRWKDWDPDRIPTEDQGPVLEARRPQRFAFQWRPDNASYTTHR